MGLFDFGKKKEASTGCCSGNCDCGGAAMVEEAKTEAGKVEEGKTETEKTEEGKAEGTSVKVLGSGCSKCNELEAATKAALERLGWDSTIEHVSDFAQIAAYGVMSTPALVINKKVVSVGKVLKTAEIVELLQKHGGK